MVNRHIMNIFSCEKVSLKNKYLDMGQIQKDFANEFAVSFSGVEVREIEKIYKWKCYESIPCFK